MNHDHIDEELLRRLEAATPPRGADRPDAADAETCRLHDGWLRVSRLLDRVVAEHDSVLIEERVRVGVERRLVQRRLRRRTGLVAVAASLLIGMLLGAWYNRDRAALEQVAGAKPDAALSGANSTTIVNSAGTPRRDAIDGEWPVGTPRGPDGRPLPIDAASDFWFEDFDWQVAMTREVLWDVQRRWHDDAVVWQDDWIDVQDVHPDELENDSA
jgi:hypothetical protein